MQQLSKLEKTRLVNVICDYRTTNNDINWNLIHFQFPTQTIYQLQQAYQNMTRKSRDQTTKKLWHSKHLQIVDNYISGNQVDWLTLRHKLKEFPMPEIIQKVKQQKCLKEEGIEKLLLFFTQFNE